MGEVQVVVEGARDPDITGFDAAMPGAVEARVIRFAIKVVEIPSGLFQQLSLIAFDGEVVMRVALLDQIAGQLALGQQGVGGDGFPLDVDRLQQWDGGFDFVGLFFLLSAGYWQGAHFFGCSTACSGGRQHS